MRAYLEDRWFLQNGKESIYYELNFKGDKLPIFHPYLNFSGSKQNILTGDYETYNLSVNLAGIELKKIGKILKNLLKLYHSKDTQFYTVLTSNRMAIGRGINQFLNTLEKRDGKFGICLANGTIITIMIGTKKKNHIIDLKLFFHISNDLYSWADISKSIENFIDTLKYPAEKRIEKFEHYNFTNKRTRIKIKPRAIMNFYDPDLKQWDPAIVVTKNPNKNKLSVQKNFSHWVVTCGGGFTKDDFLGKKFFTIGYNVVFRFPEVDLIDIIVHPHESNGNKTIKIGGLIFQLTNGGMKASVIQHRKLTSATPSPPPPSP